MEPQSEAGRCVERYRHYLRLLGRMHGGEALLSKVDLSGVVQETLLEAHRAGEVLAASPEARRKAPD